MALETSADAPAPLRQVSHLLGSYIDRLGTVWVEAEVAQLNRRPGVCFLVLRDLLAKVSVRATCHATVLDASPSPVTPGSRVVVQAKPTFYEPSGDLQLTVRQIRPTGEGELLARLERRKQLLAAEGLFDPRHKKPLPFLPLGIGLITGQGSAAERDVVENVRRRWSAAPLHLFPSLVQGPQSAAAVIELVRRLDADSRIDVIVIARGGGSTEDLLPFSDEALVREVFAATTAVVSAIGHEPDVPLLDHVADVRASTPTEAAKLIVPDERHERAALVDHRRRARAAVTDRVDREQHGLHLLLSRPVFARPTAVIDVQQDKVDESLQRARRAIGQRLDRADDELGHQLARARSLSPLATLERGYSITVGPDGHALTAVAGIEPGDALTIHVADGRIAASVRSTEEHSHD